MSTTASTCDEKSPWHSGLLLALLVWLLASMAYNRAFYPPIRADDAARISDAPPLRALLPRPWSVFSPSQVAHIRFGVCLFCLLLSAAFFARAGGITLGTAAPLGVMLIVGFCFEPTAVDFRYAPFELPLLALLCAAYFADSRNQPFRFAACMSIAALIQPWLLALLLYPLARRKPLACLFGIALFAGLMTLLLIGAGYKNPAEIGRAAVRLWSAGFADVSASQSIFGVSRALLPLDPEAPMLMIAAISIGFILILSGLWLASARVPAPGGDQARLLLGLSTVSLLLVMPVVTRNDFLLLLPALWTLLLGETFPPVARATAILVYAALATSLLPLAFAALFFVAAAALWAMLLLAIGASNRQVVEPL